MKIEINIETGSYTEQEAKERIAEAFKGEIQRMMARQGNRQKLKDEDSDTIIQNFSKMYFEQAMAQGNKRLAQIVAIKKADEDHKNKIKK